MEEAPWFGFWMQALGSGRTNTVSAPGRKDRCSGPSYEGAGVTSGPLASWHLLERAVSGFPREWGRGHTMLSVNTDGSKALGWLGNLGQSVAFPLLQLL